MTTTSGPADPFVVLGVPSDAGEEEVRARYLELVKQFPPERDPARFREIRAAFDAARDPLLIARRLIAPPETGVVPSWDAAIEEQKRNPPPLSPGFLLSLGNRLLDRPAEGVGGEVRGADQHAQS